MIAVTNFKALFFRGVSALATVALTAIAVTTLPMGCSESAPVPKSGLTSDAADDVAAPALDAAGGDSALRPVCDPTTSWGDGVQLQGPSGRLSGSDDEVLGSVSADELTVCWTLPKAGETWYADRALVSDSFGSARKLGGEPLRAGEPLGLSPDGLRLAAVVADGKSLVSFTRAARGDAFADARAVDFAAINAQAAATQAMVGDPLFSSDGLSFYYSLFSGDAADSGVTNTLLSCTRGGAAAPWPAGTARTEAAFARGADGLRKRPTGLSSDQLTLFFLDESEGSEVAAFRATTGAPFAQFVPVIGRLHASPSADCSRLYYSQAAHSVDGGVGDLPSTDLLVTTKN